VGMESVDNHRDVSVCSRVVVPKEEHECVMLRL
jgi:hypothetical protein